MSSFRYIAVDWRHTFPNEPVRLFSELDAAGWEIRKVERFGDGRSCYADDATHSGSTRLGKEPLPDVSEIAKDPQFSPVEITKEEFEQVWHEARLA